MLSSQASVTVQLWPPRCLRRYCLRTGGVTVGAAAGAGRECRHAQLIVESREFIVTVVGGILLERLKEDLVDILAFLDFISQIKYALQWVLKVRNTKSWIDGTLML